jgi:hypothetical protein
LLSAAAPPAAKLSHHNGTGMSPAVSVQHSLHAQNAICRGHPVLVGESHIPALQSKCAAGASCVRTFARGVMPHITALTSVTASAAGRPAEGGVPVTPASE